MISIRVQVHEMTNDKRNTSTVQRAMDTLWKVLVDIGWKPQPDGEASGFFVDLGPPNVPVSTAFAAISANLEQFVFYINFGVQAPPDHRDELMRFVARVNWLLTIGNFEMDFEDGHIRFKSGIDFKESELQERLIVNTVLYAMNAVEKYADALVSVAFGNKNADQAINDTESQSAQEDER
jgi:hypothetical protein